MGLFNRNKNENTIDNEMLVIMAEIRDNLKINNDEILTKLESKIADARYSNDEELGVISTKIGKLEKLVELQDRTINRLQERQDKYDELIKLIMDLVQTHSRLLETVEQPELKQTEENEPKKIKSKKKLGTKNANPNTIRKCKFYNNVNYKNIGKLENNGKFRRKTKTKGGDFFNFTINDLLLIRSLIPKTKEYPSITSITEKVGKFSSTSINDLIYLIEDGFFDKYFIEWEQIQADNTYKTGWKQTIENNPEKRKEMGIYG